MKTIGRYLFFQQAVAMIFVTLGLTCAIWLTQSLNLIKLIINRGLSLFSFIEFTVLLLPTFMLIILPIALFLSVLFTYNKLTNDREIVVMRAGGLSHMALAWPGIALAIIVTIISYGISLYLMPVSFRQFKVAEFAMRHEYSALLLQDGAFNSVTDKITIYVRERRADQALLGILVQDNRVPDKPVTMMAERGVMLKTEEGPRIVMFNGSRQELDRKTGKVKLLLFDRWSFSIDWLGNSNRGRWREPNERFVEELLWPGDSAGEKYYRKKFIAEGHNRLVAPLYSLVFVLVALAGLLTGEFNKRGQTRRVLLTVLLAVPVQAGAIGFVNLAAKVPAAIPLMYLNVLVPIAICLWVLSRSQRRSRANPAPAMAGAR